MAAAQARRIADKLERQRIMESEAENARQRLEQKTKGRKEERRLSELVDAQKAKVILFLFCFLLFVLYLQVYLSFLLILFNYNSCLIFISILLFSLNFYYNIDF